MSASKSIPYSPLLYKEGFPVSSSGKRHLYYQILDSADNEIFLFKSNSIQWNLRS